MTGEWKCKNPFTKAYAAFMNSDDRKVKIFFRKVEAHSGVEGNEDADILAKYAVGNALTAKQRNRLSELLGSEKEAAEEDKVLYLKDYAGCIIDTIEDFLDKKEVYIPNDEKEGEEGEAHIYGSDFDELMNEFMDLLKTLVKEAREEDCIIDTDLWSH